MPFELTHLAVGIQSRGKPLTPQYLAGLIYPDIRYYARLERGLTHEPDAYTKCPDKDFLEGVKMHLLTDRVWDELVLGKISTFDKEMSDGMFVGILKLVHDRVAYDFMGNKRELGKLLEQAKMPEGLPVEEGQWDIWIRAIRQYLDEGPTEKGWLEIITKMNFLPEAETKSRIKYLEPAYREYGGIFERMHKELVVSVGRADAGVA